LLIPVVPTELFPEKKDSFVGSSLINDEDLLFPEGCIPRQPQKTQG